MSDDRLRSEIEVGGLLRRVQGDGGFATILHRGDLDRGALFLVVTSRGRHVACLERVLTMGGDYAWQRVGPAESAGSAEISDLLAKHTRSDGDLWVIELDIADPERFIAETMGLG